MNEIKIDFSTITGKIKPMHAVNNPPTVPYDTRGLYSKIREAHIPYVRLHDTGGQFGGAHYVDVENIFCDFAADENDPASYDFAFTDALLEAIDAAGFKPFYRLGCTIENYHKIKAYHTAPPSDPNKWARICEHIIMHYNEGWADGYKFDIEYWEIWNEPDNEPVIADNPMWSGTAEQFFELYESTSKHLKARFPHLKIGGYASCGFYAISNADFSETAHSSTRTGYFVEFFLKFLDYISAHSCPLDFFSWHSYAGLKENTLYADYASKKLTEYGYGNAEVIFNEWNPGIANRGKPCDASNIAAMMCAMQCTKTDMCMYYDGQISSSYCGLFDPISGGVFKAYYAFRAFGELYAAENEVLSECAADNIYVCAAANNSHKLALLVNTDSNNAEVRLSPRGNWSCMATDDIHIWEQTELSGDTVTLPAHAVWLAEYKN